MQVGGSYPGVTVTGEVMEVANVGEYVGSRKSKIVNTATRQMWIEVKKRFDCVPWILIPPSLLCRRLICFQSSVRDINSRLC